MNNDFAALIRCAVKCEIGTLPEREECQFASEAVPATALWCITVQENVQLWIHSGIHSGHSTGVKRFSPVLTVSFHIRAGRTQSSPLP